ncbi:MAG TPA: rRNA adenine N-6-methyltransferase family protein [Acidimicrobiales bacterium]
MPGNGQRRAAPAPHWGWHQLTDGWARRLVASADLSPGDVVVDIGAGAGAITEPLVRAGARVLAVELHPRRADRLRRRFADAPVKVLQVDAADLRLPTRPFHVVANPPFAVTTAILRRLLAPGSRLEAAHLVVPTYVAARWASGRAPAAHRWSRHFTARRGPTVPPRAFVPAPPRAAAILELRRRR